jgi:hypothetical protein
LNAFESLANNCILIAEAHLCAHLKVILTAAGHKQVKVRSAAESAANTFASKICPHGLRSILPTLFEGAAVGVAWQTRVLSLKLIASFSDHAPLQLGNSLPEVLTLFIF